MPLKPASKPIETVEATVTSKGQVTLPKALRNHLGIQTGRRVRFSLASNGSAQAERVLYDLEDLWSLVDQAGKPASVMTFEEMDEAKSRRSW